MEFQIESDEYLRQKKSHSTAQKMKFSMDDFFSKWKFLGKTVWGNYDKSAKLKGYSK